VTARGVGLGLGICFALLTALELLLGEAALGGVELVHRTTKINIFHWIVALAMLGTFFARSDAATRTTLRIGGAVLLVMAVWGAFWAGGLGSFLGFTGEIPGAYNVYHGAAALLSLSAGFVNHARPAEPGK
jgi:hypothetical protein